MGMGKDNGVIVGLDIGTTKVCAIVAEKNGNGVVDVIGLGHSPSRGLRKGVVVNIEATVDSIRRAVEDAELMAGVEIRSAFVGIAGGHIKGINSRGVIAIAGKNREVTRQDIERVIDAAKAVALPVDREVIHVLPQEFMIDDQGGIREPLGMTGTRLEAEVHIVTGAVASAQNIIKCANKAGLEVRDIVLQQLASSEATLTPEEKELGCILVDIGGGTTDVAVFVEGSVYHTAVLAVGGDLLTNDIAIGLRTPHPEAESLKRKYGCALASMARPDEKIEVPSVGGRRPRILSRQTLCEIIQPRLEELFSLVDREVRRAGYVGRVNGGVVVTGGSSIMEGVPELAEQVFDMPVRRGIPRGVGGLTDVIGSPMYATGVGLGLYGAAHRDRRKFRQVTDRNIFDKVAARMKEWFGEIF
ncbi:MAG: cell division protein FtsA [Candidatus Rokubacteria bacterium RIFCSPLOWO2_12_FULL_69_21]|nr:MAG: cell division protein FtsA [candidate division NC10 bacterium RIFCSPLOWO2_02_FULL_66_22]OGL19158.1 MAG: cell division protein FtsA [Candidatus Rokubacteria bacterium RIFCSPLOWO2_12_FULL_69_21]